MQYPSRRTLPCWPGKRMTGPLTSGDAGGGVFGLWEVGCTLRNTGPEQGKWPRVQRDRPVHCPNTPGSAHLRRGRPRKRRLLGAVDEAREGVRRTGVGCRHRPGAAACRGGLRRSVTLILVAGAGGPDRVGRRIAPHERGATQFPSPAGSQAGPSGQAATRWARKPASSFRTFSAWPSMRWPPDSRLTRRAPEMRPAARVAAS